MIRVYSGDEVGWSRKGMWIEPNHRYGKVIEVEVGSIGSE